MDTKKAVEAFWVFLLIPALLFLAKGIQGKEEIMHSIKSTLDKVKYTNALIDEKSPYLLQHAHNPVNWFPWGPRAFTAAQKENKLIFLSIGYSTCHWCHVMERESFEDEATAKILNQYFISIKVDREERPDVDNVYMNLAHAIGAGGGWPLNLFLTPDKYPFAGGTYFPPEDAYGRPGFKKVLTSVAKIWSEEPDKITSARQSIKDHLDNLAQPTSSKVDAQGLLQSAGAQLKSSYENQFGGFSQAPKFPMGHNISLLLRLFKNTGDNAYLKMATHTLDKMASGGIYDQLGGGFHRYSTDKEWLAPHFEKMLYDQALLLKAYLEAWQVTGNPEYVTVAGEIIEYVQRDMTDKDGGFYSAEDADSEGHEGVFYLWSIKQLEAVLGKEDATLAARWLGVTEEGNFEGQNILTRNSSIKALAGELKMEITVLRSRLNDIRSRLLTHRSGRQRPHRDDKILTDWNALMISSLCMAGRILPEDGVTGQRAVSMAENSARFILDSLKGDNGGLVKGYRQGPTTQTGFLEDYAFFVNALIDLYEATFNHGYLLEALRLSGEMKKRFWDGENGGYFLSPRGGEALIQNPKESYDGAIPSGNSIAALALVRLAKMTGDSAFINMSHKLFNAFGGNIGRAPSAHAQMLQALDMAANPGQELVLAMLPGAGGARDFLDIIYREFLPRKVVMLNIPGETPQAVYDILPSLQFKDTVKGNTALYVCENFTCKKPITDPADCSLKFLGMYNP